MEERTQESDTFSSALFLSFEERVRPCGVGAQPGEERAAFDVMPQIPRGLGQAQGKWAGEGKTKQTMGEYTQQELFHRVVLNPLLHPLLLQSRLVSYSGPPGAPRKTTSKAWKPIALLCCFITSGI